MWVKTALLLVCVAIVSTTLADISDDDKLDPFDLLNFRFKYEKTSLLKDKQQTQPDLVLQQIFMARFRNSVRDNMSEDQADTIELFLNVKLTDRELEWLENCVKNPTNERITDCYHILRESIDGSELIRLGHQSNTRRFVEGLLGCKEETLILAAVFIMLGVALVLVLSKLRFTPELKKGLIFTVLIFSVATTWYTLYKREEAKQRHILMKDLPENCIMLPEDSSMFMKLSNLFSYYFTYQNDECVDYHANLIINPMAKVRITTAMSVTLVQAIAKIFNVWGAAFNEHLRSALKDMPVQFQIPAMAVLLPLAMITPFVVAWCFLHLISFVSVEHPIQTSPLKSLEGENCEQKKVKNTKKKKKIKKKSSEAGTLS